MLAGEIMTPSPATVAPEASIGDAWDLMTSAPTFLWRISRAASRTDAFGEIVTTGLMHTSPIMAVTSWIHLV